MSLSGKKLISIALFGDLVITYFKAFNFCKYRHMVLFAQFFLDEDISLVFYL